MEVAERAHDVRRLRLIERADPLFQILEARSVVLAPVLDRGAANVLDQREDAVAGLLADGVAEQPPEKANVLTQSSVGRNGARAHAVGFFGGSGNPLAVPGFKRP